MGKTLFIIYGSIISLVYLFVTVTGWSFMDIASGGRKGPPAPGVARYHK